MHKTYLSLMWQKNVWLIKRESSAVLKSWKHREISFFHEFIFVFALYIIGLEVWKKHTKEGWLCKGVVYRSVCVCVWGSNLQHTMFLWSFHSSISRFWMLHSMLEYHTQYMVLKIHKKHFWVFFYEQIS